MIKFIHGDMLVKQSEIDDNSIDLLLTDPPYNISRNGAQPVWIDPETGKNKTTIHNQKFSEEFEEDWDDVDHDEFIEQMGQWADVWAKKLRKGGAFAIFISDRYISYLWNILASKGLEPKRIWNWKKPAAVPFNRKVNPVSACEYILFGIRPGGKRVFNADCAEGSIVERYASADKISSIVYRLVKDADNLKDLDSIFNQAKIEAAKMLANRKQKQGIIECVIPNTITYSGGIGGKNKLHPTQKPTEILEYFIDLLSLPGDTILDTFAGSGSTGVAAYRKQRNAVLIERDSVMFNKMQTYVSNICKKKDSIFEEVFETNHNAE